MIRLPPTSISLSENDIQFHMQQAEIYQGLLKQGFDKQDISRYLEDHRKNALPEMEPSVPAQASRAPSTLDFACRPRKDPSSFEGTCKNDKGIETGRNSTSFESHPPVEDVSDISADPETVSRLSGSEDDSGEDSARSVSPTAMAPKIHSNMHAPRQSSLLRFSTAVSPDRQSCISELSESPQVASSGPVRRYRPQSQTDPYLSSERESSANSSEHVAERVAQLSLDDSVRSDHSSPFSSDDLTLPSPPPQHFGSLRRRPSLATLRASIGVPGSPDGDFANTTVATNLSSRCSSQSSVLLHPPELQIEIPSSPPTHGSSPIDRSTPLPLDLDPPAWPATPITARRTAPSTHTEDHDHGPRYLDGSVFSVFNDSLPATSQPQTPADLSRTLLITEREAAYTAPPGMIRLGSVSTGPHQLLDSGGAVGQESPTLHAITMRERRSRELWRSMRVESARMRRNRLRDQVLLEEPSPGTARERRRQRVLDEPWRDELDADRVGEENFETEFSITQGGVMRIVSGNARGEA